MGFRIGHQPFEPSVLTLQLLEPLRLIRLQTAVLLPPTIIRLLRHADLLARMGHRPSLRDQHIRLAQLVDDLLRLEPLPAHHLSSMIQTPILTKDLDPFLGGRSERSYAAV